MNFSPTSRTLFLVQLGTFFSGLIVVICCCLYVSAYPKSPDAESLSGIAIGTLIFGLISTLVTLVLTLRQKSGRTVNAAIEGSWVGVAILLWILASVGGIAKPANNMTRASCKVLPSGKDTDDKNFIRACQSMFASTAFCILTAILFIVTAVLLITFSIQRAVRDKKAAQVKVGGSYALGPSPSEYRRAEQNGEVPATTGSEEPKDIESATSPTTNPAPALTSTGGGFSENVYQDPVLPTTTPAVTHSTLGAGVATPAPVHVSTAADSHSGYDTYTSTGNSGHVLQPSYQSASNLYDYNNTVTSHPQQGSNNGYLGQESGHFQQSSAMSNMSANAYDQYNPYASAGNLYANQPLQQQQPYQQQRPYQQQQPYQQQPMYPQQTMGPHSQGAYPMMGPPHQQSPYGTQYMNNNQPPQQQQQQLQYQQQGPYPPIMAMPQPEHF
ncbi:hypothetical protein BGZ97_000671 [Linnemannia gamsii]|jgi:hypothetical protein|uniref:MARVEL domain-containing protein n=1 Tax=Linnemannia gamsii TaxID=64522 RepID=A0A9P6UK24_9FUNG|nr:hypothetical protein BGZ97_000671 [Linnemannia gamsii]